MAEHLKLIRPLREKPVPGTFITTTAATDILYTLGRVQSEFGGALGLISGAPGIGKSLAVLEFKYKTKGVHLISAVEGEGGIRNVANELFRVLDLAVPKNRSAAEDRRRLAEAFGVESMLVIDEAQYLVKKNLKGRDDWEAFEWLRAMAEEVCMSLVFCGDLRLRELAQVSPPLWRRLRLCIITGTPREDVEAVASQWEIADQKARDMLFAVARKSGGALAAAVKVCREAKVMAGDGNITFEHVAAAVQDLQILGGK